MYDHLSLIQPHDQTPRTDGSTPLDGPTTGYFDSYFPPAPLLDYREPVHMSLQDMSDTPVMGFSLDKGKEKAMEEGLVFDYSLPPPAAGGIKVEDFERDLGVVSANLACPLA
jgi:hypothetical protein